MCTLLIRHNPVDPYPLALLANRDEAYDRPAEGWAWRDGSPPYFAPRDREAGGTWIGLNAAGVVVALTNIFPSQKSGPYRSRGALVTDMLALEQAGKAPDQLEAAVLERSRPHRTFRRVSGAALRAILPASQSGSGESSTSSGEQGTGDQGSGGQSSGGQSSE